MTRLVLIGAGHSHALLLDAWTKSPLPGVEVMLVAPVIQAPYSGMIPGWLAGQYRFDQCVVDFPGLCKRSGARLIQAELIRLDPETNQVWLSDGQCLSYDWLSLNVGSTLKPPIGDERILAMRPLGTLKSRYETWLTKWQTVNDTAPLRLSAIGGGAAGVESLLCVLHHLRQLRPDRKIHSQLLTRASAILPGFSNHARRLAMQALHQAGVTLRLGTDWSESISQASDLVIWATGAEPHDWQLDPALRGSLHTDASGFIKVDDCLRSVSHANIFAVGDCAALSRPVPKAGVYAVRMGPILTTNLTNAITEKPLVPFKRQVTALALLNTADGYAIASWGPYGWRSRWVMRWKDWIDRRFVDQFGSGISYTNSSTKGSQ